MLFYNFEIVLPKLKLLSNFYIFVLLGNAYLFSNFVVENTKKNYYSSKTAGSKANG